MADTAVQSRFQVTDKPFLSPGCCNCCGSVDRRVVNWGSTEPAKPGSPQRLRIYLCELCVNEAGMAFGMVPMDTALALAETVEILNERVRLAESIVTDIDDPSNDLNRRIIGGLQSALIHPRVFGQLSSLITDAVRDGLSTDSPVPETSTGTLFADSDDDKFSFSFDGAGTGSSS